MSNLFSDAKPILGFFGEYRFLSNYHLCTCVFDGIPFMSSEHVYMYQKSSDPEYRLSIIRSPTPLQAKKFGSKAELRKDWDTYRTTAMLKALRAKFANKAERDMLLSTGDAHLEETNYWHDTFWGVCDAVGQNMLGRILMNLRNEYRINHN